MSGRSELWWNKDVSRLKEQRRRPISSCPICIQRYVTCHHETEKKKFYQILRFFLSPKPSNDGLQLGVDWSSVENSSSYFEKSWHQDFTGKIPAGQLQSYEKLMRLMGKKETRQTTTSHDGRSYCCCTAGASMWCSRGFTHWRPS